MSHTILTALPSQEAATEVVQSKALIETRLGCRVRSFAAPFGLINRSIRGIVEKHFEVGLGVRLAPARKTSDLYHLPRIDMYYFRNVQRWRAYLNGHARTYMATRRCLRAVRNVTRMNWRRENHR